MRALIRAAHPTQRRPDGTKRSRHVYLRPSRSGASGPRKNTTSIEGVSRRSGGDPTHGRDIYRCPRSECRSEGRHCVAWYSRDAGGSLVGRKRVRRRTTGQCPTKGQRLVDAVTGDQSIDRQFDTGGWASALASRAQDMLRE